MRMLALFFPMVPLVFALQAGPGELLSGCYEVSITVGMEYRATAELKTIRKNGEQNVQAEMTDCFSRNRTG